MSGTDLFRLAGLQAGDFEPELVELARDLALHLAQAALFRVGDWIHGGGQGKPQGVMIRAHIAFWDLLPYLAGKKQTDLAALMGLAHKQSVGREVSDFRDRFGLRNGHMQSERAREVCRDREAKKNAKEDLFESSEK